MIEVFFYGLFMDSELLERLGYPGDDPRVCVLADYDLRIGKRVTLVPSAGHRVHGVVMRMPQDRASQLYSLDMVKGYAPRDVRVSLTNKAMLDAVCYLLPEADLAAANHDYAQSLYELSERLGFPGDYLATINAYRRTVQD